MSSLIQDSHVVRIQGRVRGLCESLFLSCLQWIMTVSEVRKQNSFNILFNTDMLPVPKILLSGSNVVLFVSAYWAPTLGSYCCRHWHKSRRQNRHSASIIGFHFSNGAAAAAKLLQSCPTLCNPIDGSPPGSALPGILQARTLEWVAISFSNAWKWKVKVKSLSCVWLLVTPWTAAYQAPPSMGFSRQE